MMIGPLVPPTLRSHARDSPGSGAAAAGAGGGPDCRDHPASSIADGFSGSGAAEPAPQSLGWTGSATPGGDTFRGATGIFFESRPIKCV